MATVLENPHLLRTNVSPETAVAISQKNRVMTRPDGTQLAQVGVINTFSYSENRAVDPVRGIGYGDKIAELVPGVTDAASLTINRALLYTSNIFRMLGYKSADRQGLMRSLRHHRWPFDIQNELIVSDLSRNSAGISPDTLNSAVTGNDVIVTYFLGCWLESYDVSFTSDSAIVMENCSARSTDITNGQNVWTVATDKYSYITDFGNPGSQIYKSA